MMGHSLRGPPVAASLFGGAEWRVVAPAALTQ